MKTLIRHTNVVEKALLLATSVVLLSITISYSNIFTNQFDATTQAINLMLVGAK